jgi:hypothetical protein
MANSPIFEIIASHRRPTERTESGIKHLFCHQEIIHSCKIVMSGYDPDKHFFIDPGESIQDYFERILDVYSETRNDQCVINLPITNLNGFTLAERNVGVWNAFTGIDEELQLVKMYVPIDSYVNDKGLLVTAFELRGMLREFDEYKKSEFARLWPLKHLLSIKFDDLRSNIIINGISYFTPLHSDPLIFLRILVERNGIVAGYKVLADAMKLNSNTKTADFNVVIRAVQDVKNKELKSKLESIRIPENEISLIMQSIQPVAGVGYRFSLKLP